MSRMIERHANKRKAAEVERTGNPNATPQYDGGGGCRTYVGKTDTQGRAVGPGKVCMKPHTVIHDGRKYCDEHRPSESRVKAAKVASPDTSKGEYVTLIQTDKNTLQIIPNAQTIAEFVSDNNDHLPTDILTKIDPTGENTPEGRRYNVWGDDTTLYELMGGLIGNGWGFVEPEYIGALTSAPILEAPDGRIYWHERYQVEAAAEELILGRTVKFDGSPENRQARTAPPVDDEDIKGKAASKQALHKDSPLNDMDDLDENGWCVECDQPIKGTSWFEKSPDRFIHQTCEDKLKAGKTAAEGEAATIEETVAPVPVAPVAAATGGNPYQDWKSENLIETIESLTDSDSFAQDKPEQKAVEQMAEILSARPVEPEVPEANKAAALKRASKLAGTWADDMKKNDPEQYALVQIAGNRPNWELRNMIKALEIHSFQNTPEENARLEAAKKLMKLRRTRGRSAAFGAPPVNQDTSKVLEGDTSVPDGRELVEDNTGITVPPTELPSKFAEYRVQVTKQGSVTKNEEFTSKAAAFFAFQASRRELNGEKGIRVHLAEQIDGKWQTTHAANVKSAASAEARAKAEEAIENGDTICYDVASEQGQIFGNVKHMRWFREAVADEIEAYGADYVPDQPEDLAPMDEEYTGETYNWDETPSNLHEASKTASEVSTTKALNLAEKVADKLKALYLEAKPIANANESRPVREAVEAIYNAMKLIGDAQKVLAKQQRSEEEEAAALAVVEKKNKKSSALFGGLKLAAAFEPMKWLNHYRCEDDGAEWEDTWSSQVDDECPTCGIDLSPYKSEELCIECGEVVDGVTNGICPGCEAPIPTHEEVQEALGAEDAPQAEHFTPSTDPRNDEFDQGIVRTVLGGLAIAAAEEDEDEAEEPAAKEASVANTVDARASFRSIVASKAASLGEATVSELGHTMIRVASAYTRAHKMLTTKAASAEDKAIFTTKKAELKKRVAGTAGLLGATASFNDATGEVKVAFEDGDAVQVPTL